MFMLFGWQDAGRGCELWPRNLSPDGAGCNFHLGIVADALGLSHVAAGHDVEPVAIFSEPDWSGNTDSGLAERHQRNIFLSCDCGRDWACHGDIVAGLRRAIVNRLCFRSAVLADMRGSQVTLQIALIP